MKGERIMSRKVSVCATIEYRYTVELDDDFDATNTDNLRIEVETEDPCCQDLMKVLRELDVDCYAETVSIIDDDTGEVLY
jgi:hypothetical protein